MKKIVFIIMSMLLIGTQCLGQTSGFQTFFGTQEDEYPVNMTIGHENDIIICGGTYQTAYCNDATPFAVRLDNNGNLLNYKVFPNHFYASSNYSSFFTAVHSTNQGYLFLGFSFYPGLNTSSNTHLLLYHTDKQLNVVDSAFVFITDSGGVGRGESILDSDNNIVICGLSFRNFLIKLDIQGDVINKRIGSFPDHTSGRFEAITEAHDQNGYYLSWVESKDGGAYLLYLNKDLEFQHVIPVDSAPASYLQLDNMQKLGGENLVFTSRGPLSGPLLYQQYILGYNVPTNQILNINEFGVRGRRDVIWLNPLHVNQNSIFFTYYYRENIFSYFDPADSNAFYVVKMDDNLNVLWEQEIFFEGMQHHSRAIRGTDDGGCVVVALIYDSDTMYLQHDVLVVKLDENGHVTSRNTLEGIASPLLLYPNPGKDHFYLNASAAMERAEIYTLQGKRVKEVLLSPGENRISMAPFPPGTYMVRALDNRGTMRQSGKWNKIR